MALALTSVNYRQARSDSFNEEYVNNIETGIKTNFEKLSMAANFFYGMDFKDEIAPIGEVLDFGVQKRKYRE